MEWGKLKNLIILILLLVNGFLLVLVGTRREEALRYERRALKQTVQVLRRGGVEVDLDAVADGAGLTPMAVERDLAREAALAQVLLNQAVQGNNRGGGLYLYRGTLGEVSIRAGGELSAEFVRDDCWRTDHPEQHAAGLLSRLEVAAEQLGISARDGETAVRFRQSWNGSAVFSCEIELVYRDGYLDRLSGTLLMAEAGEAEAGQAMALPTALMRFSEEIAATGDVCSAIRSMEAGYRGSAQSLSGGTRLTPVWLVSTDTANYYLDCITGTLARLTDQ